MKKTADCRMVQVMEAEYYLKQDAAPLQLVDHQRRILNHVFTPDKKGRLPYRTIVYSCPKKSGKTEIGGAVTYAFARIFGGDCYSIANDMDQAASRMFTRVKESLSMLRDNDRGLFEKVVHPDYHERITKGQEIGFANMRQENPWPHRLQYIASDYAGEAGGMPALTVWDELWAYKSQSAFRLYDEMQPIPTIPHSIRFVTTYAGWYGESELLWNLYETVVKPNPQTQEPEGERIPTLEDLPCYKLGRTFVYWDHMARMPWHTLEFLEDARDDPSLKGRESEYKRIWQNEWTTGLDAFLDMTVVDELCAKGDELGLVNRMAVL